MGSGQICSACFPIRMSKRSQPVAAAGTVSPYSPKRETETRLQILGPALVALLTLVVTFSTLSTAMGGPGVTVDEYYDTTAGKRLVTAWQRWGWRFFSRQQVEETFGPLTLHPPLARWCLGWAHAALDPAPEEPDLVAVPLGRMAPALAYAALVFAVGASVGRQQGALAGTVSAAAVALVPRMFGHAHQATLDTITTLFFVLAVLALAWAHDSGRWRAFALAGVVWGLALACKIHGWLLLPPVLVWFLWHRGRKGIVPAVVWGSCGAITFFLSWPWLWYAPVERLREYFHTATERQALHTYYLGQVWNDVDVPWHYPWVMLIAVLPLGFLALGLVGIGTSRSRLLSDPLLSLALASGACVLLIFSWPGTPVYDGVRLFLMVIPLWAVFVGLGARAVFEARFWSTTSSRMQYGALALFVALQGTGTVLMHPVQLSHYGFIVGGSRGAERLGFEPTYWGDAITQPLLDAAAEHSAGNCVVYAPHLAPFHADAVAISFAGSDDAVLQLQGYDAQKPQLNAECRFALVYHRRADLKSVEPLLEGADVIAEVARQGVWLGRLYRLAD